MDLNELLEANQRLQEELIAERKHRQQAEDERSKYKVQSLYTLTHYL